MLRRRFIALLTLIPFLKVKPGLGKPVWFKYEPSKEQVGLLFDRDGGFYKAMVSRKSTGISSREFSIPVKLVKPTFVKRVSV